MALFFQSHSGNDRQQITKTKTALRREALVPDSGDIAVDEAADFGFIFPYTSASPVDFISDDALAELDTLGEKMVLEEVEGTGLPQPDSGMPAVMTYWGQFLDHELTARTDRETEISKIDAPTPIKTAEEIENDLKNARSPRFDLDSVYGGFPIGLENAADDATKANVAKVINGMRHPAMPAKMRVGTCTLVDGGAQRPDGLDEVRDLPRFGQVEPEVKEAFLSIIESRMGAEGRAAFEADLDRRALIGDMRNDENLIVAQFHVSFLRFHNRTVDFLEANDTGWIADFHSAQALTKLHYQWLIVNGYLKGMCDQTVLERVLSDKAKHFFDFRRDYYGTDARKAEKTLGDAIPLEFSVAAYRFGHSMVRDIYDYNRIFGRPTGTAPFQLMFLFTGKGQFAGAPTLPDNWIIDWTRFLTADGDTTDGGPARVARRIDTMIAPPLGSMSNEANEETNADVKALFKHLAKRNLRRGLSLRLPTGQALHAHLKAIGAVTSDPISDVSAVLDNKPELSDFMRCSEAKLHERTPLWFYLLAEAEAAGGDHLGEVGSWIVASTFVGTLLSDPDSALSTDFEPAHSPLRMPDGTPVNSLEKWMKFALVLEG